MKRNTILVLLLFFLGCQLFADRASFFMEQKAACFNVNLASKIYRYHEAPLRWAGSTAYDNSFRTSYYDNQIITVIGVENSSVPTKVTFNFTGIDWYYVLNGTDTRYKRPFGVDLVVRANMNGHTTLQVRHLGRQSGSTSLVESVSVELPVCDGTNNVNGYYITSVWMDVVLVMEPFVNTSTGLIKSGNVDITDTDNMYYGYLTPSDDIYTTSFSVTIESDTKDETLKNSNTYSFMMNGYYGTDVLPADSESNSFTSFLQVMPNANALSLDIKKIYEAGSTDTVIGTYSFGTSSIRKNKGYMPYESAYFFLSSSPDGATSSGTFKLKYISPISGSVVQNTNKFNSIGYKVGIRNKNSTNKNMGDENNIIWFDGTDNYSTVKTKIGNAKQEGIAKAQTVVEYGPNTDKDLLRVYDDGDIFIKIDPTESEDINKLSAGRYRSNVYFHVVTDW